MNTPWLDTRQGAIYLGFTTPNAWQTINRWIRKGMIPERYVGQRGRALIVKPEGLDAAVRAIRARRRPGR